MYPGQSASGDVPFSGPLSDGHLGGRVGKRINDSCLMEFGHKQKKIG